MILALDPARDSAALKAVAEFARTLITAPRDETRFIDIRYTLTFADTSAWREFFEGIRVDASAGPKIAVYDTQRRQVFQADLGSDPVESLVDVLKRHRARELRGVPLGKDGRVADPGREL